MRSYSEFYWPLPPSPIRLLWPFSLNSLTDANKYLTRAKLYITRLHQKGDRIFLLQFIGERLSDEEQEQQKRMQKQKEEKKARQIEQKKKDKFKEATSFTSTGVGSSPGKKSCNIKISKRDYPATANLNLIRA